MKGPGHSTMRCEVALKNASVAGSSEPLSKMVIEKFGYVLASTDVMQRRSKSTRSRVGMMMETSGCVDDSPVTKFRVGVEQAEVEVVLGGAPGLDLQSAHASHGVAT